jgi:hypothetical protein
MTNHKLASQYSANSLRRAVEAGAIVGCRLVNIIFAALSCALLAAPTASAAGVSQIVLSCTTPPPQSSNSNGCGSSELVTTPPIVNGGTLEIVAGFWLWGESPKGGTPYGRDCAGSMYVEEVNLATGAGHYDATSVSGTSSATGPTGLQVTFTSSDSDVTCTIDVPSTPTRGPTNQLGGTCNGIPITFSHAVAQVTSGGA